MDLICAASPPIMPDGKVIVNLSGGPREILIALTAACMSLSRSIYKITNWSDIDLELREIELPHITRTLDKKTWQILNDVMGHEPTALTEVAARLGLSEAQSRASARNWQRCVRSRSHHSARASRLQSH